MMPTNEQLFERLPKWAVPMHYDLWIEPNWCEDEPQGYSAVCTIDLRIDDNGRRELLLNSIGAEFSFVEFEDSYGICHVAINVNQHASADLENEILRLRFAKTLNMGMGTLTLKFRSVFCDIAGLGMKGIYRSKYKNNIGQDCFNYLSFFAPTYSRNAFPSFDEPDFKTTFDISIVVPPNLIAVSNMPIKSTEKHIANKAWEVIHFERTPKMSTYLASWMIGEFDFVQDNSSGVPIRVYTPIGKAAQGNFALDVASKALKFFTQYFGISYPLPKLDLAALGDFPCGAMENWGLITFREALLLVDEKESSVINKLAVGTTVCHEIAHSWFGNLVTMEWWTDLWLNEGFASFMQNLCYNSMVELNVWDDFQVNCTHQAKELDSLSSSHPIEVVVNNPSDIDEIFDTISYKKGASIISMLHDWLGDIKFRCGLSGYLEKFSYGNAETKDLWEALEKSSEKPVGMVMATWTQQKGYPLIIVSDVKLDLLRKETTLKISSKLFRLEQMDENNEEYMWQVPLTFISFDQNNPRISSSKEYLLEVANKIGPQEISLNLVDPCLKVNRLGIGFFRVHYQDETYLDQLGNLIYRKVLWSQDRINMLDDLFALTIAGVTSTKKLMEFLNHYREENNYFVWSEVGRVISSLNLLFTDRNQKLEELRNLALNLFKPPAVQLGWDARPDDKPLDLLMRALAIQKMVENEEPAHLEEGKRRFNRFQAGTLDIPGDLRIAVYKAFLHGEGQPAVDQLLEVYRQTDLLEEKLRILSSFAAVTDPNCQEFLLNFSISNEVRMQDAVTVIKAVSKSNRFGQELAWNFFKTNWERFQKQFTGLFIIGNLVRGITENFSTKEMEENISSFFKNHSFRGTNMTVRQSLESVRIKRKWIERIDKE